MFTVHFISIVITSAPHQVIRHEILEVGDTLFKGVNFVLCDYILIKIHK